MLNETGFYKRKAEYFAALPMHVNNNADKVINPTAARLITLSARK